MFLFDCVCVLVISFRPPDMDFLTGLFAISGSSGGASGRCFGPLKRLIGGLGPFKTV